MLISSKGQQQEAQLEKEDDVDNDYYYSNFVNALKTKTTKIDYTRRIKYFMNFLHIKQYAKLVENKDKKTIENDIKSFLVYLRKNRKISYKSAFHYLNAIKKFYYVNSDYDFKWKLIKMYLGNDDTDDNNDNTNDHLNQQQQQQENQEIVVVEEEEDRPYTRKEIQTMLKTANDLRVKIVILLISSSGIRIGAIPQLKLRNLKKIEKYQIYQINIYEGSRKSNYKTFCTPECSATIDTYLNYRKHSGEQLNGSNPLIREQFNPSDSFNVNHPKHILNATIRYLINEVLVKYSSLKQKLRYDYENKRKIGKNSTMQTHALRKFFDTEARKAGMYPDFVELLMGHKLQGVQFSLF